LKLYNSQSEQNEVFRPLRKEVSIYVCGITPYDTTHLGHAFTYTSMDVLIRYLELQGLRVRYVQNVTDIDDDILRKAKESQEDWRELGNRWTIHFIQDLQSLNVRPPDYYVRATDVIPDIIESIQKLFDKGVAYKSAGNVYFSISAWPEFGKLSHIPREQMLPVANERGNHPDDPHKRDPLDFVLWQSKAPGEPDWESPWGPGRPGWHIECSTMSTKFLGLPIDIHGGGADLCFPHHECEIAQVEPITGDTPFVRYWLHTAMVRYQGEKMSKSLGNLVMVRDLLETYSPDALRVYLGMHHYRDTWSFNESKLIQAAKLAEKFRLAVSIFGNGNNPVNTDFAWKSFTASLDNDLYTPDAFKAIEILADSILEAADHGNDVKNAQQRLRTCCSIFGLKLDAQAPEARVQRGWNRIKQSIG
jgi:L-cysteine:1D-myo-inositol 2-amino-2-deoxy-alpha-D-glucopyranoside ligase